MFFIYVSQNTLTFEYPCPLLLPQLHSSLFHCSSLCHQRGVQLPHTCKSLKEQLSQTKVMLYLHL